jgi:hypothetical protein
MKIDHLPTAVEITRLQRLRDAFLTGESRQRPMSIVAEQDWLAELDARLESLHANLPGARMPAVFT